MKNFFLHLFFLFLTTTIQAQTIEFQKAAGSYKFTQEGKRLKMRGLVNAMQSDPEALALIKKARHDEVVGIVFSGAGGFLIGTPIGTYIGGGDPNWTLAGIGVGMLSIGFAFGTGANKKAIKAVELYNSSLTRTSFQSRRKKPQLGVVVNGNGLGLSIQF